MFSRNPATASSLHIEWSPGLVRAVDVATGKSAKAESIPELGAILTGHRNAFVGIGRGSVFLKSVRLPKAAPEDLRRVLGIQIGQLFPLTPDQLSYDFIQTADHTADGYLTIVGAMRSQDMRALRAELKQAGLDAIRIVPVALGSQAVASAAEVKDALVMECGPGGLGLDLVQNGILTLSRNAPDTSDPASQAQRTMAAGRASDAPVIAVGALNVEAEIHAPQSPLELLHQCGAFDFELTEERDRAGRKRATDRVRLAICLLGAALLIVCGEWGYRHDRLAAYAHTQSASSRQEMLSRSVLNAQTQKEASALALQSALSTAFKPAQPISDISSVITDSLPTGAWLSALSVERGKPVEVRGAAKQSADVSHFVDALAASPRFRDVKLVFANNATIGKTSVVEFDVTAWCVGNLPMPAPEKKRIDQLQAS